VEGDYRFTSSSLDIEDFKEHQIFKRFQETIVPAIEGMVRFTKKIPTFSTMNMADRILLLKQNGFCIPLILVSF